MKEGYWLAWPVLLFQLFFHQLYFAHVFSFELDPSWSFLILDYFSQFSPTLEDSHRHFPLSSYSLSSICSGPVNMRQIRWPMRLIGSQFYSVPLVFVVRMLDAPGTFVYRDISVKCRWLVPNFRIKRAFNPLSFYRFEPDWIRLAVWHLEIHVHRRIQSTLNRSHPREGMTTGISAVLGIISATVRGSNPVQPGCGQQNNGSTLEWIQTVRANE